MDRNIQIAYILAFCKNSWFWLGVWIFYYLLFTNYAGIGLIETAFIATIIVSEIPAGAVADLLGKKGALLISFLLQAVGGYIMAFAPHFAYLVVAVTIMGIGGSFYSGTIDALVYDSLKQIDKQNIFDKVISRINALSLIAPAICGAIGGYLYLIQPNLPFIANSFFYSLAIILCIFIIEPKIDSQKFSFNNFLKQTSVGLSELLKSSYIRSQTLLLLSIGVILVICDEMLNSFLGVEFGFKVEQLGILWSVIYLVSAAASHYTPLIKRFVNYKTAAILIGLSIALTLVVSPILGIVFGGIFLLLRTSLQAVYGNVSSILINESTQSQNRTTTLSTFNLLKNIPYLITAYLLGSLAEQISAVNLATILGLILIPLILLQLINFTKRFNLYSR